MFCRICGKEISEEAVICPHCGAQAASEHKEEKTKNEHPFVWGILSFFLPLVGLILIFVFWKKKPISARMCLRGTIVGILAFVCAFFGLKAVALFARNLVTGGLFTVSPAMSVLL